VVRKQQETDRSRSASAAWASGLQPIVDPTVKCALSYVH